MRKSNWIIFPRDRTIFEVPPPSYLTGAVSAPAGLLQKSFSRDFWWKSRLLISQRPPAAGKNAKNHLVCWYACSQPSKIEVLKFFIMVIHNPLPKVLLCNFHRENPWLSRKKTRVRGFGGIDQKNQAGPGSGSFESLCPSTLYRQIIILNTKWNQLLSIQIW